MCLESNDLNVILNLNFHCFAILFYKSFCTTESGCTSNGCWGSVPKSGRVSAHAFSNCFGFRHVLPFFENLLQDLEVPSSNLVKKQNIYQIRNNVGSFSLKIVLLRCVWGGSEWQPD